VTLVTSDQPGPRDSTASRPGRRRRHQPDDEVTLILDGALAVMRRNGYAEASVADILDEAGLSTRAFYRHFDSKDALLRAVYRRDADAVADELRRATEAAPDPVAALEAWLDGFLALFFDQRRAERVAIMVTEGTRRAAGYHEEEERAVAAIVAPLVEVLRHGRATGALRSDAPIRDAYAIYAVATSASGSRRTLEAGRFDRRAARDHVARFCWPALGLDVPDHAGGRRRSRTA
jgi:AcrR family transcriptional regulator